MEKKKEERCGFYKDGICKIDYVQDCPYNAKCMIEYSESKKLESIDEKLYEYCSKQIDMMLEDLEKNKKLKMEYTNDGLGELAEACQTIVEKIFKKGI